MEAAMKVSIVINFVLALALYIAFWVFVATSDGHHREIAMYQDRAIKGGVASKDDTGTFYWLKK